MAISWESVRIEWLHVENKRAGLKIKIMSTQKSKNVTVTFHQKRGKVFSSKTSAAARYGLWHMHTVVFVKIGYKRGEQSRGEQKNGPSDL